ncbi:MAG: PAS domain S-box protein [Oscillatoriales cyanobacterium]|nr:MAG: PAS domain S-box protein [Oscillatoriales cyanobacterium]
MCSEPTDIDRALTTCEALVAEQKEKIRQLEENLQEEIELRRKLEAQLKRDIIELTQTEASFRQNQEFMQRVADTTPGVLYIYDLIENRNLYGNRYIAEFYGCTAAQVQEMGNDALSLLVYAEDIEKLSVHVETEIAVAKDGEILETEYRIQHPSGELRWFHDRHAIFSRTPDGRPKQIVGVAQDITERIEADAALRENQKFIHSITEALPGLAYIYDITENRNIYTNNQVNQILGYSSEQVQQLGDALFPTIMHPDDLLKIPEIQAKISTLKDGEIFECEYRLRNARGEWRWFMGRDIVFLRNSDGSPKQTLGIVIDITEHKRVALERIELIASLEKSQEMYRTLIKHYPNGSVFLFDSDLRYILVDGQGLAVVGLSKELVEGKTLSEISPPEDLDFFETKYRAALAGEENNFEYKYRDRFYSTTVSPVKNDQAEIFAGMVVTQDITEKKQSEFVLQRLKNELEIKYHKRTEDLRIANQHLREEIIDRWRTEEFLRESQEQLELFFSQSLDGFFFMMLDEPVYWDDTSDKEKVLDYVFSNGRVTKANDALIAQYGATREEFIGVTLNSFLFHNLAGDREIIRQFFDAGRIHIENDNRKFDGELIWVEGDYICIDDSQGRIAGYFGVQRDISDRKKAEAALRDSEERFRATVEQAAVGITHCDKNGRYLRVNQKFCNILGYTAEELLCGTWMDVSYCEDLEPDREKNNRLFDREIDCFNMEKRLVCQDGSLIWVNITVSLVQEPLSGAIYNVAVIEDISDRKKAEAALKESEERFRQLAENIESVFWMVGVHPQEFIYVSPGYEKIWGRSSADLYACGRFFAESLHPEDRARVIATFTKQVLAEDEIEYRIVRPDGEIRWIRDRAFPIRNQGGEIYRVVGIAEDISQAKQAEKAIRESEERFRQLAENIQDSFWLVSADFTDLLYLSPAYEQIWGRSREELYAEPIKWMEWVHPEDIHLLQEGLPQVLQGEFTSIEYRIVLPDGTIRWVCDRAFPIYDEAGKIYRLAGICEDISDRKLTEARIQAALREKEVLLKEIHHRVKNNMQVVSSLLQLQAQYIEDEPTLALFEESQTRIHSMALIHEQLYQSENIDRIHLPPYVENLIANLYQSFGCGNTSIKFNLNVDSIYLNIETAIPCGLIINELVSNSLKYAFGQSLSGEISINFNESNFPEFHLSIQDDGSGFPADFDVESSETLGLRLVRMLTQQLEGNLVIDTECGTCYHITFLELNYRRRI